MTSTSPIILILGAGARIGHPVARMFAAKGYKVALAARTLKETESTSDQLHIKADFANPAEVPEIFAKVKKALGIPSVVLYNAASVTFSPPNDPFAVSVESYLKDMSVNTTSVYLAAQQAILGFKELPASAPRSFFFTGNICNLTALPGFMDQAMGKAATANMIKYAANAYKDKGYKFYYVDERKEDGTAKYRVDGEAHGDLLLDLVQAESQGPWLQTFVKGLGYRKFDTSYE